MSMLECTETNTDPVTSDLKDKGHQERRKNRTKEYAFFHQLQREYWQLRRIRPCSLFPFTHHKRQICQTQCYLMSLFTTVAMRNVNGFSLEVASFSSSFNIIQLHCCNCFYSKSFKNGTVHKLVGSKQTKLAATW